eukprot:14568279-Alexandrium_andersonii.AAC.1
MGLEKHRALAQAASAEAPVGMEVGALEPESPEVEADEPQLQVAFALLQRAFRPGKGRGKGGEPSSPETPGGPVSTGGAEGPGKGGYQG